MTQRFKKILSLIWMLPLLALLVSGCADPTSTSNAPAKPLISKIQPQDIFVHEASQMAFSQKVGDFTMEQVSVYDETGDNISVEYTSEFMGFTSAIIKVYVYPAPSASYLASSILSDYYQNQKDSLLSIFSSAYEIEEGEIKIGQPFGPQQGMMLQFKRQPNDVFPRKECFEKLYLFEHGKWIIKYRVTNPTDNEKQISRTAGTFMQILQWPELTH